MIDTTLRRFCATCGTTTVSRHCNRLGHGPVEYCTGCNPSCPACYELENDHDWVDE